MASLSTACRFSARIARSRMATRGFTTSARCLAAQNFVMPALSPTMTEGNIASWKVKEGDTFSAGDVLLEIETDKATMDVEAQEDGAVMRIFSQDGSKAVQVGSRIAVLAEAGDDISALELPPDESSKPAAQTATQSELPATQPDESKSARTASKASSAASSGTYEHNYPLLPSVGHLVHEHGLSKEDVSKIQGTGPSGRLLKGDVLAFLGSINPDRPAKLSSHFDKLAHLDLSNIKVAPRKVPPPPKQPEVAAGPPTPERVTIEMPVSLSSIVGLQRRLAKSDDTPPSVVDFLAKATALANLSLPLPARPPTADELFDQVLGLDKLKAPKFSRGSYVPKISVILPSHFIQQSPAKTDIIDILASPKQKPHKPPSYETVPFLPPDATTNFIKLDVPKEEKHRARVFLARCKTILEEEPESLLA